MFLLEQKKTQRMFLFEQLRQSSETPVGPQNPPTSGTTRPTAYPICGSDPPRDPFPAPQNDLKKHLKIVKNESNKCQKKHPKNSPGSQKKSKKTQKTCQKQEAKIPLKSAKISQKRPPKRHKKKVKNE